MSSHAPTAKATTAFYLTFRRWCMLNRSDAVLHQSSLRRCVSTHGRTPLSDIAARPTRTLAQPNAHTRDGKTRRRSGCALHSSVQHDGMRITRPLITSMCSLSSRQLSTQDSPDEQLADSMRRALRTFTKPCVLVTSCTNKDDISTYSGVTLSSFDAITLDPVPHISFNIRVPSRTYDAIRASKQICVHILSATTAGATIADTFTRPYATSQAPFEVLKEAGAQVHSQNITPQLHFNDGVISWLICEESGVKDVDIGDHKICTFVVKDVIASPATGLDTAQALAYGQKAFRKLGEHIEPLPLIVKDVKAAQSSNTTRSSKPFGHKTVLSSTIQSSDHPIGPLMHASSFHSSSKQALTHTAPNMATFKLSLWNTGIGSANELPSRQVNETPEPVPEETLRQTVDDFLCHSQHRAAGGLRVLRIAQKQIEEATDKLQAAMADGSLTIEECEKLEDTIGSNERYMARTLAHRAALDLREMLDQGHVSESRVQFIEHCIEKGQAALLHEAKDFAEGRQLTGFGQKHLKIPLGDQGVVHRQRFEEEEQFLKTELMRLRDHYQDEED